MIAAEVALFARSRAIQDRRAGVPCDREAFAVSLRAQARSRRFARTLRQRTIDLGWSLYQQHATPVEASR